MGFGQLAIAPARQLQLTARCDHEFAETFLLDVTRLEQFLDPFILGRPCHLFAAIETLENLAIGPVQTRNWT